MSLDQLFDNWFICSRIIVPLVVVYVQFSFLTPVASSFYSCLPFVVFATMMPVPEGSWPISLIVGWKVYHCVPIRPTSGINIMILNSRMRHPNSDHVHAHVNGGRAWASYGNES
jgi:hypothetical protein